MVRWCGRTAARRNGSALYQTESTSPRKPRTPSARVGHPGDVGDAGAAVGAPRKGGEQGRPAGGGHQVLPAPPCLAREPHPPPLRPAAHRTRQVEHRRRRRAAREDEALQRLQFRVGGVDPALQRLRPRRVERGDVAALASAILGRGGGEHRADGEQVGLHLPQPRRQLRLPRRLQVDDGEPQRGVELVDLAVSIDAHMVLRDAPAAEETRLAAVAGLRVDLHGCSGITVMLYHILVNSRCSATILKTSSWRVRGALSLRLRAQALSRTGRGAAAAEAALPADDRATTVVALPVGGSARRAVIHADSVIAAFPRRSQGRARRSGRGSIPARGGGAAPCAASTPPRRAPGAGSGAPAPGGRGAAPPAPSPCRAARGWRRALRPWAWRRGGSASTIARARAPPAPAAPSSRPPRRSPAPSPPRGAGWRGSPRAARRAGHRAAGSRARSRRPTARGCPPRRRRCSRPRRRSRPSRSTRPPRAPARRWAAARRLPTIRRSAATPPARPRTRRPQTRRSSPERRTRRARACAPTGTRPRPAPGRCRCGFWTMASGDGRWISMSGLRLALGWKPGLQQHEVRLRGLPRRL